MYVVTHGKRKRTKTTKLNDKKRKIEEDGERRGDIPAKYTYHESPQKWNIQMTDHVTFSMFSAHKKSAFFVVNNTINNVCSCQ